MLRGSNSLAGAPQLQQIGRSSFIFPYLRMKNLLTFTGSRNILFMKTGDNY